MTVIDQNEFIECQKHTRNHQMAVMSQEKIEPGLVNFEKKIRSIIPQWFQKITIAWPHLDISQACQLGELVYHAPNHTITVHSGRFMVIDRPIGGNHTKGDLSWSCCHAVSDRGKKTFCEHDACINKFGLLSASNVYAEPLHAESSDRRKVSPHGKCDKPITFSLDPSDFV